MTLHTPGPWAVGKSNGNLNTVICLDAEHPHGTALAFTVPRNKRSFEQCEVDALLMSKAPEMLDALKNTLDDLRVFSNQVVLNDMIVPMWVNDRKEEIEHILAELEGEDK